MRAHAAAGASPRRDSDDSAPTVTSSEQQPAAASLDSKSPQPNRPTMGASLDNLYPNLHSSNFVEHSTASRLHARLVSHRVHTLQRKRSVAIDARGQLEPSTRACASQTRPLGELSSATNRRKRRLFAAAPATPTTASPPPPTTRRLSPRLPPAPCNSSRAKPASSHPTPSLRRS